jgi:hypothetical protein
MGIMLQKSSATSYNLAVDERQSMSDSEHVGGVTNERETHQIILGSLKVAIYLSQ